MSSARGHVTTTCFVTYEMHPTARGGAGVLIHHAADRLLAAGHEVVLILGIPASFVKQFMEKDRHTHLSRPENCRAYCVDELCADMTFSAANVPCSFQWESLRWAHALRKVREIEKIDYVEFFDYCGAGYYAFAERLYAKKADARPVLGIRLHNTLELFDRHAAIKNADRMILHGLERQALALSETVLSPSKTYYERYTRDLYKVEPTRIVVSSPPKQDMGRVRKRPDGSGPFAITFVGRMFQFKGVEQLVRAAVMLMEQRPELDFTVEMIGYDSDDSPVPGSFMQFLKTLVPRPLSHRFVFTDHLTHEQILVRLESSLFAVFPNRMESFCYALHEVYDAGVPVIVNDQPAFLDFFEHERNALVYDGTTPKLLASMQRLIDDAALRERLCKPYAVADRPLGDYYERPAAAAPLAPATPANVGETLVVVLCEDGKPAGPALDSLRAQTLAPSRVFCLVPASADAEARLWWLGRPWHVHTPEGTAIDTAHALTTDTLAVVEQDDVLDPAWLETCARALSRRPSMAFAGTWPSRNGVPVALSLDVTPELWPFERHAELARVLVRTRSGTHLADLFDTGLGPLGHLGYLWKAIGQWGHGVLSPTPLIETAPVVVSTFDANNIRALIMRYGAPFAERLSHVAGLISERLASPAASAPNAGVPAPLPQAEPTVAQKVALADELGGRTLARLALKKLAKRVVGKAETPNGK
jgi:glycosyltransferase involved in cell wall biosynthesis